MSLDLTHVTVSRGAGPVISDVTLSLEPGTVTAIVGPNGAGKTSLLEAISGVIAPSAGVIELDGTDLARVPKVRRYRMGLVHMEQGRAVFPGLTARENVRLTAPSDAEARDALAMFPEIDGRLETRAALLSGGQQQMVVLARSFAARPKYLLIDEMSLGLSAGVFRRLIPIVKDFAAAGAGVLLVEQFTHAALQLADHALVVTGGRVTYNGPAASLAASPRALADAYLGATPAPSSTPIPKE